MSTFSHHAMQKWASPSLSLVALYTVNPLYWLMRDGMELELIFLPVLKACL